MAKLLTSWLVPSFLQHNLRPVLVLGHCSLIVVMKFRDKFVSLQQFNSPNSWDKFQICCIDMYWIRFLANFAGFRRFTCTWISWLLDRAKYQKPWSVGSCSGGPASLCFLGSSWVVWGQKMCPLKSSMSPACIVKCICKNVFRHQNVVGFYFSFFFFFFFWGGGGGGWAPPPQLPNSATYNVVNLFKTSGKVHT